MTGWHAPVAGEPVDATVAVPASKSLMARALVLAALADEPTTLHNPLVARDSLLMAQALRALGATVEAPTSRPWVVAPPRWPARASGRARATRVDCGLSGTVMRFVPPLAALSGADVTFDGDPRARERPMIGLLEALRTLEVHLSPEDATSLPVTVHGVGHVSGGPVQVDAGESSQYVSGLLMAGSRFERGVEVEAVGEPPSTPHIDMTLAVLRERGVAAHQTGPSRWRVAAAAPAGGDVAIEPDLSNAAPFLAAAVVTGGRVRVEGWPSATSQPGPALLRLLAGFGATIAQDATGVTVTGPDEIAGLGEVDLSDVGELVPTVAAVASLAEGPTMITGVGHLRGHETDRLAALGTALRALGSDVDVTAEGLVLRPSSLRAATVCSEGDHRMATFGAIIGLVVPGVVVDDVSVTSKTMPDFPRLWAGMLA